MSPFAKVLAMFFMIPEPCCTAAPISGFIIPAIFIPCCATFPPTALSVLFQKLRHFVNFNFGASPGCYKILVEGLESEIYEDGKEEAGPITFIMYFIYIEKILKIFFTVNSALKYMILIILI